jgi:hypothetical protein
MAKAVPSLLPCIDSVLGVRDAIGAVKRRVYLVTREWSGRTVGDGIYEDSEEEITPQPGIRDVGHDVRIQTGGAVQQGDLFVTNISKNRYSEENSINGYSDSKTIEKFYRIGDYLYTVIHVKEKHLTWHVQVRKQFPRQEEGR